MSVTEACDKDWFLTKQSVRIRDIRCDSMTGISDTGGRDCGLHVGGVAAPGP